MKKWFIFLLVLKGFLAQASDCPVSSFIETNYQNDARLLVQRELLQSPADPYADSIILSDDRVQSCMGELSAVYNLGTNRVDSLFTVYSIHAIPSVPCNELAIEMDTTYSWVRDFLEDSLVSGLPAFDSLVYRYGFRLHSYFRVNGKTVAYLHTNQYLNLAPLADSLEQIEGLGNIELWGTAVGDGPNLHITHRNDTAFIDFSLGWGDCPAGCTFRQYWHFSVIDCQATYLGTSGDRYSALAGKSADLVRIYPNPANGQLTIEPGLSLFHADVYSLNGIRVMEGRNVSGMLDVAGLLAGQYILVLSSTDGVYRVKFTKL